MAGKKISRGTTLIPVNNSGDREGSRSKKLGREGKPQGDKHNSPLPVQNRKLLNSKLASKSLFHYFIFFNKAHDLILHLVLLKNTVHSHICKSDKISRPYYFLTKFSES